MDDLIKCSGFETEDTGDLRVTGSDLSSAYARGSQTLTLPFWGGVSPKVQGKISPRHRNT